MSASETRFAGLVDAVMEGGADGQAGRGRGAPQVAEHGVPGGEGLAGPVRADRAEQAMLDRVPLRAAGRIVADGHGQAVAGRRAAPGAAASRPASGRCCCRRHRPGSAARSPRGTRPGPRRPTSGRAGRRRTGACRPTGRRRRCPGCGSGRRCRRGPPARARPAGSRATLTASASWPQTRPAFLKRPISSFFLVSTLISGSPAALNACRCSAMYSNC